MPIPHQPTYIGGPSSPVHSGPWDYLARVPLFAYGPGVVPAKGVVERPATMADVAPTIARLIGSDFDTPDGDPLDEVVSRRRAKPRLVVVIVWDGAGWNVLNRHPDRWPYLRRISRRGVLFENFEIGSTPSNTPPIHTTLGTGVFPRRHGIPGVRIRVPEVGHINPFAGSVGDRIRVPTLADVYDPATGNRARIGLVATTTWHLGMIGKGSRAPQGDRDLTVLLTKVGRLFGNSSVYRLGPQPDRTLFDQQVDELDRADGAADGRWGELDLDDEGIRHVSPAFTFYQQRVLEDTLTSQGFGQDEIPDLMFTNFKQIDVAGHKWGLTSPQVGDAVAASDAVLRRLVTFLNGTIGRGDWTLLLTADHGQVPQPEDSGIWPVAPGPLGADVNEALDDNDNDVSLIERPSASGLFVDRAEARELGVSLEQIAEWLIDYRAEDNLQPGQSLPEPWADDPEQRLFAGVVVGRRLVADSC